MTKGVKNDIAKRHIATIRKNTGASAEIGKKTVRGTVEISELWKGHSKVDIERAGRVRDSYRADINLLIISTQFIPEVH